MAEVYVHNVDDFEAFMSLAKRGDRVRYHRGYLPFDLKRRNAEGEEVRKLADIAKLHSNRGQASLVQRRHGEADYDYLAERC